MSDRITFTEVAERLGATLEGNGQGVVAGVASLREAGPGELSFVSSDWYREQAEQSRAGGLLVPKDLSLKTDAALLRVDDVAASLDGVLSLFAPPPDRPSAGVHSSAEVAESARLGEAVAIGAHVVIGEDAEIGDGVVLDAGCVIGRGVRLGQDCWLGANVVVGWDCRLGQRVRIHPNTTIGADGFGYHLVNGAHQKVPHIGIVVIEDDVEIGANSCIDRAKIGETVIGRGTKIDNLVQVAHNVRVGEHCILVAQVGIAGSTELEGYVVVGGQAGVADHLRIGEGAMLAAASAVVESVPPGVKLYGMPAIPQRDFVRQLSSLKKLPELIRLARKSGFGQAGNS